MLDCRYDLHRSQALVLSLLFELVFWLQGRYVIRIPGMLDLCNHRHMCKNRVTIECCIWIVENGVFYDLNCHLRLVPTRSGIANIMRIICRSTAWDSFVAYSPCVTPSESFESSKDLLISVRWSASYIRKCPPDVMPFTGVYTQCHAPGGCNLDADILLFIDIDQTMRLRLTVNHLLRSKQSPSQLKGLYSLNLPGSLRKVQRDPSALVEDIPF